MQDAKEEVRSRLEIEDVIGEYVQLKRAGRNFKGLSPFTSERTPSFVVSPDKQIWHDFSSGKGGDIFSFIMLVEGLDFRAALEFLAQKAGVDLGSYQSAQAGQIAKKRRRLLEANQLASKYYQQSLLKNHAALEYVFQKRQLSKDMVHDFLIGYAPNSSAAMVNFLLKKGFSKSEIKEAGLTNRFGGDLFRERMMVSLMDASGQVIGFTARILKEQPNAPKYLNTPQTLLYDKSRHVFGLAQAKEAIRKAGYSVLVEGNLDVVSSHQVGVRQVVATAGTALTIQHLKILGRLAPEIRLAFDGDKAGIAATERAISLAQQSNIELKVITLPNEAKDPDELIQQSSKAWQQAINQATPAVDWLLSQYAARQDLTSASGKRIYSSSAMQLISMLKDPVEQDHYLQVMAQTSGASLTALNQKLKLAEKTTSQPKLRQVASTAKQDNSPSPQFIDDLLAVLMLEPSQRNRLSSIAPELFGNQSQQALADFLSAHQQVVEQTPVDLQKIDDYVKMILLRAEIRYATWSASERSLEVDRLLRKILTEHNKTKKQDLIKLLEQAEAAADDKLAESLRRELNQIIKEMKNG